jgi:hypothetical protein
MAEEILTYREMCDREGAQTLQRGMNYRCSSTYSLVLMSRRSNAPYHDRLIEDGTVIEYEGHNVLRVVGGPDPKNVDQPRFLHTSGKPTQNGKFADAVDRYKSGMGTPEPVRVYDKIHSGVWSYRGLFYLTDYEIRSNGTRQVFRFRLEASASDAIRPTPATIAERRRVIPSEIKALVWRRDQGKCVMCGATDELHFDHDLPFSRGGTSVTAANVRLLCVRHNLQKGARIE